MGILKKTSTIIIILILIFVTNLYSATFNKHGFYSVNIDGWIQNSTTEGDIFTCAKCKEQIQIQISYGPPLPKDALYKNNKEFIQALKTEKRQEEFAESFMKNAVPAGFNIKTTRTGITTLGGIEVFQFQAVVDFIKKLSYDTSMMAIHRNRIMKITLNYFDSALTPQNKKYIESFYKSIRFY